MGNAYYLHTCLWLYFFENIIGENFPLSPKMVHYYNYIVEQTDDCYCVQNGSSFVCTVYVEGMHQWRRDACIDPSEYAMLKRYCLIDSYLLLPVSQITKRRVLRSLNELFRHDRNMNW